MSVRVMSQVWDLKLPHADKFVLLAMADHADHDGNNVYPGDVRDIALKTGYSERQVKRIVSSLDAAGLIVREQPGREATMIYRIEIANAERVDTSRPPSVTLRDIWDKLRGSMAPMVYAKHGYFCGTCGATSDLTIDHVVPISRGGSNHMDNLRPLCRPCNSRKHNKTAEECI